MKVTLGNKIVLVLGGYGAVGSAVCEELAKTGDFRILVAGRHLRKAEKLAYRLGERVEPVQIDASEPDSYQDLLSKTTLVVNCVEDNNFLVAKECLKHTVHYIEVSATIQLIEQLQTLHAEAKRADATAVLSVGVTPGLTNLLAHYAQSCLGPLEQADLIVLLGLGEVHGEAATRWLLQNLGKHFFVKSGDKRKKVRSFGEARSTRLPEPFGLRTAFRIDISDQHTLPDTLGIKSVNTWLCFDSRLATRLVWLLANSGLPSVLPLWRASGTVTKLSDRLKYGSTEFIVQVDALGINKKKGSYAVRGVYEAQMTGMVAAHVAKHLLRSPVKPGVFHIEQLLNLDGLLAELGDRITLFRKQDSVS